MDITQKFTTHLKNAIKEAADLALKAKREEIEPIDLLIGLLRQRGSIGTEVLVRAGLKFPLPQSPAVPVGVKEPLDALKNVQNVIPKFSEKSKKVLEKAALISSQFKHKYVGTEHLLYGLLEIEDEGLNKIYHEQKINLKELRQHLNIVLKSTSKFPDLTKIFEQEGDISPRRDLKENLPYSALDFFCTDLTSKEAQKNIDPLIGREEEINRLIHILSRRTKNNPVLIGEPGTGKTAIVEGLAKRILEGQVPEILQNKKILSLDLSLVVAGTIYRGEFEGRIKQIIEEIKNNAKIILFIDEIHMIIGAGSTAGSMDAANILKPVLAKGEIRCIGATTLDEYRKHIESDAALERRLQPIIVEESTPEETLAVLKGIKRNYELYHRVLITNEALQAAVDLSVRYLQDKFLPDKAIDLIDEAAAQLKINQKADPLIKEIKQIEEQLILLRKEKEEAVIRERFEEALSLKNKEKTLGKKIAALKEKQELLHQQPLGKITAKEVIKVISRITKIPLNELSLEEKDKIIHLEKKIGEQVIGQEEAIKIISGFIKRSRAGLSSPNRPLASFIFLGPTGVGKTEMAKVIARTVFEGENSLIRIDMSEFAESFQASKLIGAPAGYVGYKEGGKLTESVRRKPYAVVLFDEVEKAHPEIFNLLLQIFEDGQLTDAVGKKVNFKNTIIILTSNVGLSALNQGAIGFESDKKESQLNYENIKQQVLKELEKTFKPEFLNRVDKIIVFKPLDFSSIKKILALQIEELKKRLKEKGLNFEISPVAVENLAKKSFRPEKGAREVRRVIQEFIENPLADKILQEDSVNDKIVKVKTKENKILVEY